MVFIVLSGTIRSSSRPVNFSNSAVRSSLEIPSSFCISLSCSRRKNCRCCSVIFSSTRERIRVCNLPTSISCFNRCSTFSIRRVNGMVRKISSNSSDVALVRIAPKSASGDGSLGLKRSKCVLSSSPYNGFKGNKSLIIPMTALP